MIEAPPPLPQGDSHFHTWARWVQQTLLCLRMCDVAGQRVNRTTRGVQVIPRPGGAQGGGGVVLMTLISIVSLDQLVCRPDGAASDGSQDISVATQTELRVFPPYPDYSETIDGEVWGYSGYTTSTQSRLATRVSDSATEYQVITPRWIIGQKIPVWRCPNTGMLVDGKPLPYITISGREWAKQYPAG